jgi:hypothetical protein
VGRGDLQTTKRNEDEERRVLNFEMGSNSGAISSEFVPLLLLLTYEYENSEGGSC